MHAKGEVGHVEVRVSESTRKMSRPPSHDVESFLEEYERLVQEKHDTQGILSGFKGRMLQEQTNIRRNGDTAHSARNWAIRRGELETERAKHCQRLDQINQRLVEIKDRAMDERAVKRKASVSSISVHEQYDMAMLIELKGIRAAVEALLAKWS